MTRAWRTYSFFHSDKVLFCLKVSGNFFHIYLPPDLYDSFLFQKLTIFLLFLAYTTATQLLVIHLFTRLNFLHVYHTPLHLRANISTMTHTNNGNDVIQGAAERTPQFERGIASGEERVQW